MAPRNRPWPLEGFCAPAAVLWDRVIVTFRGAAPPVDGEALLQQARVQHEAPVYWHARDARRGGSARHVTLKSLARHFSV